MQEKLNALSLAELRALAKELGLRGVSSLRKAELAEAVSRQLPGAKPDGEIKAETAAAPEKRPKGQKKSETAATPEKQPEGQEKSEKAATLEKQPEEQTKAETAAAPEKQPEEQKKSEKVPAPRKEAGKRPGRTSAQEKTQDDRKKQDGASGRSNENRRQQSADRTQRGRDHRQQTDRRQAKGGRDRRQESGKTEQRIRRFGYSAPAEETEAGTEEKAVSMPDTELRDRAAEAQEQDTGTVQQETALQQREEQEQNRSRKNPQNLKKLDSGLEAYGILEVMPEGFGFIRSDNYLPGEEDIYVSPSQIRRFNMKTGDFIAGNIRVKTGTEKYAALLYVQAINDEEPEKAARRVNFEDLTPVFPNERLHLERPGGSVAMRIVDLLSPVGKGQRGMIVSPPKAGKTTLLKEIALATQTNHPDVHIIILLIDERPEEVTDIKESIPGENVEVIYSTFDEEPEHHKRVAEMVLGRAQRLVEHGRDVMILLDSITRLARAYNLTVAPSGRTLSGGLDPAALHMPKKFFGAARNMREGGSLTIMATALVDTGSRMDDVVFEEFKGTGNMELVLDRKLSERRIFPAIDIIKSGTRRDDLLLSKEEQEAVATIHRGMHGMKQEEAVEEVLRLFTRTRNNADFVRMVKTIRL